VKHASKLDFFERSNANFPEMSANEIAFIYLETRLHGIATSDSHNRADIGNGYIESEGHIDFSSAHNLKESLASMLHNSGFEAVAKKRNPQISTLSHGCLVYYDTFRRKHGLL
ncbi:MAG: hypothetical protein PHF67_05670, partial [Candidatus Nanoarchaeia archaeon]|nr:hypothetical protein [Candidatus Nanoarchaeia archaeon]